MVDAGDIPDEQLPEAHILTTSADAQGQRLDRWLAQMLPEYSRSAIQRWIRENRVLVDGFPAKASLKLEAGQQVRVSVPAPRPSPLAPEDIPLAIVYEDEHILVVDKPAGLVVHPAPGHRSGTLVNAILHHCPDLAGVGGERRPGIVHRLDKDTSGLIVVAKDDAALQALQRQFARRTVYKEYLALVEGRLEPPEGRIVAPIGRHPVHRQRMAVLPPDPVTGEARGREAVTEYHTLALYSMRTPGGETALFTLVQAMPRTGRTHQIRVHFAWMKHPLVGDPLYGYRRQRLAAPRHFLHAHKLRFRLPGPGGALGEEHTFVSPLPADLQRVLSALEESGEEPAR
ncbi:MAG: RluA family pseudouridine synthase [Caldilineae bacterium]|nr:MAG: RluA family pseudouridine synthase [Caldilineae bacterium]